MLYFRETDRLVVKNRRLKSVADVIHTLEHAQGLRESFPGTANHTVSETESAVLDLLDEKLQKWGNEVRDVSNPLLRSSRECFVFG
jgi:hypothetical protein